MGADSATECSGGSPCWEAALWCLSPSLHLRHLPLLGNLIEMQFKGAAYNPQLGSAVALVMMLVVVVCMTVMNPFNDSKSRSVWAGFTLDWYDKLFHDQMILDALYTTLAVSVLASVIATIAGTFAAIGFYNMKALAHSADDGE